MSKFSDLNGAQPKRLSDSTYRWNTSADKMPEIEESASEITSPILNVPVTLAPRQAYQNHMPYKPITPKVLLASKRRAANKYPQPG
eukprot:m.38875 g.38875  ORF g.38875 m.38875 type:complete len:86 (-) comp10259_c1_seq1:317-574(-)